MAELSSFGEWLRRRRKAGGWTQEQLALQINCSTSALKKFETEERRPSAQIVERFAEIFNIPKKERTQFFRFARGDWEAIPAEAKEDHPWQISAKFARSNLPATTTSLIGRQKEIAFVGEYLSDNEIRLVTLIGPPGIGKTRLSIGAAHEFFSNFRDGVFFVPLAPLNDLNLLAPAISQTLGLVETGRRSPMERLKDGIGEQHMLLVLDNLEHLIEDIAPLVSELLISCPSLKILTTSREALRVPGEWLYSVPTLDVPEETSAVDLETISKFPALILFAERARAVRSDFVLNSENIQNVSSICAQLDGLPLAIELIAARIRLMSPQDLLERLSGQFILSADGMRAVSERQKTLQGAIAWSYKLLSEEEQKLFARLSVFAGGFTLEAVEVIFSRTIMTKSISDLIASLLDKSLLQRTLDQHGKPRFSMLVTIEHFARERLRQMGEAAVRDWHLTYFLGLAEQADKHMHGPEQVKWINRLEKDLDNFRAALACAMDKPAAEPALRLSSALATFWNFRTYQLEGDRWIEQALSKKADQNNQAEKAARARALYRRADLAGEMEIIKTSAESALALCQELQDQWGMTYSRTLLANYLRTTGNAKSSQPLFEQSLDEFHRLGDAWGEGWVSVQLAAVFLMLGLEEDYFEIRSRALACARLSGDRDLISYSLLRYASDYMSEGNWDEAEKMLQEAEQLSTEIDSLFWINVNHFYRAQILLGRGNPEQAKLEAQRYIESSLRSGEENTRAKSLLLLTVIAELENDLPSAVKYLSRSLELLREIGSSDYIWWSIALGRLRYQQGEHEVAKQSVRDSLTLVKSKDMGRTEIAYIFYHLGGLFVEKQTQLAVQFLALADTLRQKLHYKRDPTTDKPYSKRFLSAARAKLSEDEFTAAWQAGLKWKAEEALDLASKTVEEL